MPSKKQKAKEAKLKKKRAAMQAAADTGAEPEEAVDEKLPEGELLEWLHDQILLKWQGRLSPAHEAKLDTLPGGPGQWCSLKAQFTLACKVLGGSLGGEPPEDKMKQVISIAKEQVREGSPPARPGLRPSDAWSDARAEEAFQLAKLDEFRASGKNYDEELASLFPLFEGSAPVGHPYPAAWTGKPPRPGAVYVPIHPSNGKASERSMLQH